MADGNQIPLLPGALTGFVRWTHADEQTLREAYARGGVAAAREALPGRSDSAIYNRAVALKLRSPRQVGTKRRTWPHDAQLDSEIRRAATASAERGIWTDIARRWKRPQWYISRRAADLGCSLPRNSVGTWTDAELELLHATSTHSAAHAAVLFRRRGFTRTTHAIQHKRWMMHVERGTNGVHTGRGLGALLGISQPMLARAIRSGSLKARRDGGRDAGPDAMWLIHERDVRAWLVTTPYAFDLRKVPPANQAWLVSVLAGHYAHD
jgi:hypothetical protein